jgi:hypothetical protein
MKKAQACLLAWGTILVLPCRGVVTSLTAQTAASSRPVSKVITLLKDMLQQLEKEAEEDEEVYDKMACWCQTNEKEKTKSISDAEVHIKDLSTKIEEYTAMSARFATEIKNAKKEVAENQESLDKATAMRRKQLAEFNAEEKDVLESIAALKAALVVLSKQTSFLQVSHTHMASVAATLKQQLQKHPTLLEGSLDSGARSAIAAFLEEPEDYFDAEPTFKQSYAPQSGQIVGILSQMKETFEANLAASQADEAKNQKAYEALKAAKEEEIAVGQSQIDAKTQELAATDEKNSNAKVDSEETKASLKADEDFLLMLKEKCQMTDTEWEERQKTRQLEMEAVSKALAILSGDEAHAVFTNTFNPALVQSKAQVDSKSRQQASKLLSNLAGKWHSPRLATIALQVKLDAFTKVKKAIDDLVAALLDEKKEEIKKKDFCIDEFNKNQVQTDKKEVEKKDTIAKIEDMEMTIKDLTTAITELQVEIEDMQNQLKQAGDDRDKENKDFQMTVADQRETQKLLQAALSVLEGFYGAKVAPEPPEAEPPVLAQREEPVGPAPPPDFETYSKSGASGDVMAMIGQIMKDAKQMEAEAIRADEESQQAYEDFVKEINVSIEAKNDDIRSKSEQKSKTEQDLVETKETKEEIMLNLEQLTNYNAELHQDCDFTLKNFEVRQTARDEEIEALRQAKAILSGAKFEEFLQNA